MKRCNTCRWWHATASTPVDHGRCRRYPPVVLAGGTVWPMTHGTNDWCAKYTQEPLDDAQ